MGVPPKVLQDMQQAGGRHYKGRGLGALKAWNCVSCGAANTVPMTQGCASCGAGAPGKQVRRPGEPIEKAGGAERRAGPQANTPAPTAPRDRPARRIPLADQLRQRTTAAAVDYDEIERRVARALEARLGGGYTAAERQTLLQALEVYIALWDDGTIEPDMGLSIEATRQLAQKIAPEDMESTTYGDTESTTESDEHAGEGEYVGDDSDPSTFGYEHGPAGGPDDSGADSGRAGPRVVARPGAPGVRPAPELLDADHRGDEGGEDDAAGDGG